MRGPTVKGPTVKKLAVRLILGRSQLEQRIVGNFREEPGLRGGNPRFHG
jgi:hypothetical protein